MGRAKANLFLAPPHWSPGEGSKGQISFTFSIMIFISNFVCVLTKEGYKIYQTGLSFCRMGHAPRVGFWGAVVVVFFVCFFLFFFVKHYHVAYKSRGRTECK